jgi:hypothetical protein
MERFPFAVFYLPAGAIIHVFGVLHTSRNPQVWQTREQ